MMTREMYSVQHRVFFFLNGRVVCLNWECVQRKEQTVVYAFTYSLRIDMNSDVWCTARRVGAGTLFF
jgi:hypothetical protein